MPQTAETVARRWKLTREELDEFALRSHQRAVAAIDAGHFDTEIIAIDEVSVDEGPRRDTTLDILQRLRPVTGVDGMITAGNSSSLNDGAAAVVLVSEDVLRRENLTSCGRLVTAASAGVDPEIMGIGPVPATEIALRRAGWSVTDLDAVELNEAFDAQSLACIRDLGLDPDIVNADGGAIAPRSPPRRVG